MIRSVIGLGGSAPVGLVMRRGDPLSAVDAYDGEASEDADDLTRLEAEWAELQAEASEARLSDGLEWARCCWREGAAAKGRRIYLAVRREGRLRAILPLLVSRHGPFRVARPLACQTTEYCPLLMAPAADPASVWTAMVRVIHSLSAVDAVLLPNVRNELAKAARLASAPGLREIHRVPVRLLPRSAFTSWESYWSHLPHQVTSNVKRARRRMSELGELEFRELTDPQEREAAWSWMVSHKRDWLVRKRLDHAFIPTEAYARFTRATLDLSTPIGRRSIFALRVNGELVAADLVNIDRRRVEMFVCTYEPAFARFAPGNLLREQELRWAFAHGLDYDWRLGDEPYKAEWASHATTANTYVLGRNLPGRLFGAYFRLRTALARHTPPPLRRQIRGLFRWVRSGG